MLKYEMSIGILSARRSRNLPIQPLTPSYSSPSPPGLPPKYTFLPTHIPPSMTSRISGGSSTSTNELEDDLRPYGFLGGFASRVTLSLEDVGRVIQHVGNELKRRGESGGLYMKL